MSDRLIAENTPIAAVAALIIVGLLVWRLKPAAFRSISWQTIGVASALFWGLLAFLLISNAWGVYYSLFTPSWYRFAAPLGAVIIYALVGITFRWAALQLPGNPVIWFCLLGGLESIPEHTIAIYRFDILQIPILQGSSATSIFIFAFFEYAIYWGLALALAVGIDRLLRLLHKEKLISIG